MTEEGGSPGSGGGWALHLWSLRAVGLVLLILTLTPIHRVLDQPETGRFGGGAVLRGDAYLDTAWWGILVSLLVGAGLAYLFPAQPVRDALGRVQRRLQGVPPTLFAALAGGVAASLALIAGLALFKGFPTLVDGMVAVLHGRMMAGGELALSLPSPEAAWVIPNTLLTPQGWISQYPPLPSLLLAGGFIVGAHWIVGPILVGLTVFLGVLTARELFPGDERVVFLGGTLLALCPFLIFLGGGYLSHLPAAASGALALYSALRARGGHWGWSLLTGAASGLMVTSRPWLGLMAGVAFPVVIWLTNRSGARHILSRCSGAALAGLPFALAWGWYNQHFFGHPLRMGYSVAFGPAHDLGFHPDPWGNLYGPTQALGFTAQDLMGLGVYLLETPFPAVAAVGLYLLVRARPSGSLWILLGWAMLPVLANLFYWHHGSHLGPRMLYEAAPAWIFLAALAGLELSGWGSGEKGGRAESSPGGRFSHLSPGNVLLWTFLVSLLGGALLVPNRARSYRWEPETLARITPPQVPEDAQALVFVHGSWTERIAARLQADGMRLDSIESALRRNDVCRLHTYAMLRTRGRAEDQNQEARESPPLDFQLLATTPAHLEPVYITEGNRILVESGTPFSDECEREATADFGGIISLPPLVWQGDLPGVETGQPMFVRDLGWKENREVMESYPGRTPYLYLVPAPGAPPELWSYPEGMERLWGGEGLSLPTPEAPG